MNRTFSIKGSNTINQYPNFGVPQGSVLGPYMFVSIFPISNTN